MKRAIPETLLAALAAWLAFGQTPDATPKFEIASVHASPKAAGQSYRTTSVRGSRYEVKYATIVDLAGMAYGFAPGKVLGGPNWLELDRFDVIARMPADTATDTQQEMLQALLADRFKLVVHKDTKPVPAMTLSVGKKPLLKEASGTEPAGCQPQTNTGGGDGSSVVTFTNSGGPNAGTTRIAMGPGGTVQYSCRNVTIAAFADALHTMLGVNLGSGAILDDTGLKGNWNFDLRYSMAFFVPMPGSGDRISIYDAIEKQLGLKLEEKPVPTPVLVVDSVNRKPTENPPGVAEALPSLSAPAEFEVVSIKPADPDVRTMRFGPEGKGRIVSQGLPLRFLVYRAFSSFNNTDLVVGLPGWTQTDRYDVVAKLPGGPDAPPLDNESLAYPLRALLVDRCKMKYHTEDRPVSAYSLVAAKPKMKKADPDSRIFCKLAMSPPGAPAGSQVLTCQNASMALLAERLQGQAMELSWPVLDATGIEGGWDFSVTFSRNAGLAMRFGVGGGGGGDASQSGSPVPTASEPVAGITVFEAIEKQLGLKLEKQKRTEPVIVIDRFEKPTEN